MPQTCACVIKCAEHAVAPVLMEVAQRMARIVNATVQVNDRFEGILADAGAPAITLEEAIYVLRQIEADLDCYGAITSNTEKTFLALMSTLNGPDVVFPVDRPF